MSSGTTALNWKRPPEWERFKREAEQKLPARDSSTGIMVELAWSEFKKDHRIESIVGRLLEATDGLSGGGEGKKITRDRFSSDGRATVKVDESVKQEMKAYARKHDLDPYMVLRSAIANYLDGGLLEWAADQLEKLESRIDFSDLSRSAPERRRDEIINALERNLSDGIDGNGFTLEQFNQAIDDGPQTPKTADDNAREKYLPMVLDELDMTWHPGHRDFFVPADDVDESPADVRKKPKALMDESDVELALAIDAAVTVDEGSPGSKGKYTKHEAVEIAGVAYNTVAKYMHRVAAEPGYTYDQSEGALLVNLRKVTDRQVLDVLDTADEWVEGAVERVEEMDVDIREMPDEAREPVLTNKIARAKNPDIDEFTDEHDHLLEQVTDAERQTLLEALGLGDGDEDDEITAADERMDQLTNAQAATDGGTTRGDPE